MADDALAAGTIIDGEYRIEGVLGSGGMGVVYRARDLRLDRAVAVKVHRDRGQAHERLAREATALARLSHPNVVAVFRVGSHEGRVYVAMELVEGGTLRRKKREPPLDSGKALARDWRDVVRLHCAAGDGLAAAHAAGLVHRDYKPDNVLVGADGRPRVADFGLAMAVGAHGGSPVAPETLATAETVDLSSAPPRSEASSEETAAPDGASHAAAAAGAYLANLAESGPTPLDAKLTVTGAWVGTPAYMAPEQLDGGEVDARSDQFSFAVALWEGLHGKRPFPGDSTLALRASIARQQLEPGARNEVPGRIDDVLRRALREAPGERWPSMDAILVALRHDPNVRRRRIAVGAGAIALAGATAVIAWQVRGASSSSRPSCDAGAADIAATWSSAHASKLRERLVATGLPYAPALADHLVGALDAYAARWAESQDLACRARADGTWSAALADRAVACLARRRHTLAETVNLIGALEGPRLDAAPRATDHLPSVADCVDPGALDGADVLPTDPAEARKHERASAVLARAEALNRLHDPLGTGVADEAVTLAAQLDQPRLRLDAAAARAEAAYIAGEGDAAAHFEQVYFDARAAKDESLANACALRLVHIALYEDREADARNWLRHAAAGARATASPGHRAAVAMSRAYVEQRAGNLAAAIDELERARVDLADDRGADNILPDLLDLESGLLGNQGELERAIAAGRETVRRTETRLGPRHPALVPRLSNLALSLSELGQHAEAAVLMGRAVAVCELAPHCREQLGVYLLNLGTVQVNGEQSAEALVTLARADAAITGDSDQDLADRALLAATRGLAFEELDRLAEAEAALRDALALSERARGTEHPDVAQVLNNLGNLLNIVGRHADAAPLLERAVAIWAKVAPGAANAGLPMIALGRAQLGMGRAARAATTLRAAIALLEQGGNTGKLPVARLRLSQAQWALGDRAGARATAALIDASGVADSETVDELAAWRKLIGATP